MFNYDGRIYGSDEARMLQRPTPISIFSLGTIQEPVIESNSLYKSILSQSFISVHPGCASCAYQPFCGSDPCQNISVFGEPIGDKSLSRFCQYHKAMFTLILSIYTQKTALVRCLRSGYMSNVIRPDTFSLEEDGFSTSGFIKSAKIKERATVVT